MSAFDFFFPQQAQASHLRDLVRQKQNEYYNDQRDKQDALEELKYAQKTIQKMEREMGETQLLVKAMMEMMEESGVCNSNELLAKIQEIDLRDGVADGQVTAQRNRPKPKFETKRDWRDSK